MRVIRRQVRREGHMLKDGGYTCVLPADVCRRMGAEFVISSDVWEISSMLRGVGLGPAHPKARQLYPRHYRISLQHTDLHIHPYVPLAGYWPNDAGMERMIAAGERAARQALAHYTPSGNASAWPARHSDVRSSGSTARV